MVLIGLLGHKRSGKDTFADYCNKKYDFKKKAFAQPLKDVVKILFNFTDAQLYGEEKELVDGKWNVSPRETLQYIGTDLIRNQMNGLIGGIGKDFWLKKFEFDYKNDIDSNIVVSDVRYQNEVDLIKKLGGIIIKINRNGCGGDNHESEKKIDNIINFDYNIENNGTIEEYYKKNTPIIENLFET